MKKRNDEKAQKVRRVGRPAGRHAERPAAASFSLGQDYIQLLNTLSEQLQVNKSAIVRDCINRLATRFKFQQAKYDHDEIAYRPPTDSAGDDAMFSLGDAHKALLDRMGKLREEANIGKPKGVRLVGGKTQLLRDEIDRLAVDHGVEPLTPIHYVLIAPKDWR